MNIVEHLRERTWPTRPEKINMGDYGSSTFVREGHVETRALQKHQSLSEPIPAGESAITSLCCGRGGVIYGATSGKRSHLFCYNPGPGQDGVDDLGVLPGARENGPVEVPVQWVVKTVNPDKPAFAEITVTSEKAGRARRRIDLHIN